MISLDWVKDYIDIDDQDLKELAEKITKAGINIENGNIESFKENLEILLNIINETESIDEAGKIKLLEKIISYLIEIIMEKNSITWSSTSWKL